MISCEGELKEWEKERRTGVPFADFREFWRAKADGFVGRIGRTESVCHLSHNLWHGLEFVLLLIFWSYLCVSTYSE
jgi:hypothetical protein